MAKDLTTSRIDRQNILNNELAIEEIQNTIEVRSVFWNDKYYLTKDFVAIYFCVDIRRIERYYCKTNQCFKINGSYI